MEQAKTRAPFVRGAAITLACFLVAVAALGFGSSFVQEKTAAEQAAELENSVRRAAILYYAVEGRYPVSTQELAESYDLRYNHDRFIVHIDSFASNFLPDIKVLTIGGDDDA